MFRIRLLGRTSVEGDVPVAGAALQRHRLALLALLANAPGRALSRDKLIAYLWPESDTPRARHLLRNAVHVLRRELGEKAILTEGAELRLNPDLISSDVGDFIDHLAREARDEAVRVYAGPFLDGFHLNDAPEFEHWLDAERDRLGRLYRSALEELAASAAERGSVAESVEWWRRLSALDPFSARVTLGLMRSLEAAGDRAAAIQLARSHQDLLCEELGAEPDPAVAAFAEQLRVAPLHRPVVDSVVSSAPDLPEPVEVVRVTQRPAANRVAPTELQPVRNSRRLVLAGLVAAALTASAIAAFVILAPHDLSSAAEKQSIDARTIAVLPFTNVGNNPNEEYFSDGLTEELIAALARVPDLRVAARTSVFAFKGEDRDIRQIGDALNVGTVLEGSVRKEGGRVRVHAQLIDASNGFHLWSKTYERSVADIFDLQTELALSIVEALQMNLSRSDRKKLSRSPTENLDAHTAYLKGRYYWNQRSGGGLRKSIEYFEQAIAIDSLYATAYAGLASAYGPMGVHGFIDPNVARERMRAAARRAIELDPTLPEALVSHATYRQAYEWDFVEAEKQYRLALELDPNESTAHTWYGFMLEYLDRYEEAVAQRKAAADLDPVTAWTVGGYGTSLLHAGHLADALDALKKSIELDSTYWQAHVHMGIAYQVMGDLPKAIGAFEKARAYAGVSPKGTAGLAGALALAGRTGEARQLVDSLRAYADASGVHAPVLATTLLVLDGPDEALAWLEQSYRDRHPDLARILTDPRCSPLRDNPQFIEMRRRIGLKPHANRFVDAGRTSR